MDPRALARKWRPQSFAEIIGQQHVLTPLTNSLNNQRLHHAYLFTGGHGVGKTTAARIMAKALNCEQGVSATPCGQCNHCQQIGQGRFFDLIEVDAASRTKVEDTRELLENAQYAPVQGRYKVYLIDEVHMLSTHSFNALLKTLEEPPAHVIFLLATTDPQKLPVTVLSRCLQFHLRPLSDEEIIQQFVSILQKEKINYDNAALSLLAHGAAGSMRDGLSLLDQAIASNPESIDVKTVQSMLDCVSKPELVPLIRALGQQDHAQLVERLQQFKLNGLSPAALIDALIEAFHQIALLQKLPALSSDNSLAELCDLIKPEDIQLYYQIALQARGEINQTPNPSIALEMALLRMLVFKPQTAPTVVTEMPTSHKASSAIASAKPKATIDKPASKPESKKVKQAAATASATDWTSLSQALPLDGMTKALAAHCAGVTLSPPAIALTINKSHSGLVSKISQQTLQQALSDHFGQAIELSIEVTEARIDSPTEQALSQKHQANQDTVKEMRQTAAMQAIEQQFSVTLESQHIQSTKEE